MSLWSRMGISTQHLLKRSISLHKKTQVASQGRGKEETPFHPRVWRQLSLYSQSQKDQRVLQSLPPPHKTTGSQAGRGASKHQAQPGPGRACQSPGDSAFFPSLSLKRRSFSGIVFLCVVLGSSREHSVLLLRTVLEKKFLSQDRAVMTMTFAHPKAVSHLCRGETRANPNPRVSFWVHVRPKNCSETCWATVKELFPARKPQGSCHLRKPLFTWKPKNPSSGHSIFLTLLWLTSRLFPIFHSWKKKMSLCHFYAKNFSIFITFFEIEILHHKIHPSTSWEVFRIFTEMCNHQHYQILDFFF